MLSKPTPNEYPKFYHTYIKLLEDENLEILLHQQAKELTTLLSSISEEQWNFRYEPGKWSVKELVGHLIDNEIIMHYRLIHISRGDEKPISGYNQEKYIAASNYHTYSPDQLINYYKNVRQTTLFTMKGITDEQWLRTGKINEGYQISARAIAYIIVGHELHHLKVLKEKYI
ncbi:DinB family protein [Aquibacillus kalidii]|uniref:DinB family protein n=1 Tax=Aquibacillus kalidii TaxID=2762597 RepID=UPI001644359F|nr:DinB family protein [Aquibacillus kalidii]